MSDESTNETDLFFGEVRARAEAIRQDRVPIDDDVETWYLEAAAGLERVAAAVRATNYTTQHLALSAINAADRMAVRHGLATVAAAVLNNGPIMASMLGGKLIGSNQDIPIERVANVVADVAVVIWNALETRIGPPAQPKGGA